MASGFGWKELRTWGDGELFRLGLRCDGTLRRVGGKRDVADATIVSGMAVRRAPRASTVEAAISASAKRRPCDRPKRSMYSVARWPMASVSGRMRQPLRRTVRRSSCSSALLRMPCNNSM